MGQYGFNPDELANEKSDAEIFREARLDRDGLSKSQWPSQIDRAALDVQYGIAIGKSDGVADIGGEIGGFNFHYATGAFYVDGLQALVGEDSSVAQVLDGYDSDRIGQLAYRLNEFRHQLLNEDASMDINRALEALVEKEATSAIGASHKSDRSAGAGLRQLENTDSATDITIKLFSDSRIDLYSQALLDELTSKQDSQGLLERLDRPVMTTPLWDHQYKALREWVSAGQQGYVDMATATGKTVLGLAALAYRYGELHPADLDREDGIADEQPEIESSTTGKPQVLIVAGNNLILRQWRSEFDEHLDIPRSRTDPVERDERTIIELNSADIEFRTAQGLIGRDLLSSYDLVILDEAHRYTRRSGSGRGWGDLFETLTERSDAVLAMSGSVDGGWTGDQGAREALDEHLTRCMKFGVPKARDQGVIADFSWKVHYAVANDEDVEKLSAQTQVTRPNYDAATGELDTDTLELPPDEVPTPFDSYGDIRSFAQSNTGGRLREQSDPFDLFSSALLARRPVRWNMSPALDGIAELVAEHAPEASTVVLVQSYDEVGGVKDLLTDEYGFTPDDVVALEQSREDRFDKIERFNEIDGGVIIGPGDLLGVGVDMPDAEVAINIARGGVNASLVQRIGRVLRDPTGDKTAEFYHVVPRPITDEAIHPVEDGAKLLRRAAEYHRLGETFKQLPAYEAATDDIESTIVELENEGVKLLNRLDDLSSLVEEQNARKHLRRVQGHIQEAKAETPREDSILIGRWSVESQSDDETTTQEVFPERNEAYEQYRLTLDPYRAGKRVASYLLETEVDSEKTETGWELHIDEEYEGTTFHEELERWLTEYKQWYDHCRQTENGDGEPATLPDYRQEWPNPPQEEGALLPAEVAAEIGIDYADSDPIFFPRTDDGVYEFPLPDGRVLSVTGIHDPEAESDSETESDPEADDDAEIMNEPETDTATESGDRDDSAHSGDKDEGTGSAATPLSTGDDDAAGYAIRLPLVQAASQATDPATTTEAFIVTALKQTLQEWIGDEPLPTHDLDAVPTESVELGIDERLDGMLQLVVDDAETPHDTKSEVIEAAVYEAVDTDLSATTAFDVQLNESTALALERISESDETYESVDALIKAVIKQHLERH